MSFELVLQDDTSPQARHCGECQLCCRLLPVREIDKKAGEKCQHQKFGVGCKVYARLAQVSPSCVLWSCRWLVNNDTADLRRPDRSHYVIDMTMDFVTAVPHEGAQPINVPAIQVWVDPKYPDAHRDPALRAYLDRRGAEDGAIGLIRYASRKGFALIPPSLTDCGWVEHQGESIERDHTPQEIHEALSGMTS
jgi:hypothetical protein